MWEEIIFRNNDIVYDVFTNTDRMTESAPRSGGVIVLHVSPCPRRDDSGGKGRRGAQRIRRFDL